MCYKLISTFLSFARSLFSNLSNNSSKEAILLLDSDSKVIASSDIYHIPIGAKLETNTNKEYMITTFAGRDYLATSCATNGYEGFMGLGWIGHVMIPLDFAFSDDEIDIELDDDVLYAIMKNELLFEKELLSN